MNISNYEESHPTEAQLVLALDGELEQPAVAEIGRHVEHCDVCRAKYGRFKQMSDQIARYHQSALQSQVRPEREQQPAASARGYCLATKRAIITVSSVAAGLACLVWSFASAHRPAIEPKRPSEPPQTIAVAPPSPPVTPAPVVRKRATPKRTQVAMDDSSSFIALPFSDAALPLTDATVVRVRLAAEDLQLAGLPMADARPGTAVQADLLIGIDGLPRGFRLIHQ